MRVDDYRYYGQLFLTFGMILVIIGIALPIFTTTVYRGYFTGNLYYESPYLGTGIALFVIGIILIVISRILFREYRFRSTEQPPSQTPPHST